MTLPLGYCRLCGELKPLSFEHIPPKSAFNDRSVLFQTLQDMMESRTHTKFRKGIGKNSLCEACNNLTGGWYGTAFVDWTYQGMVWFDKLGDKSLFTLPYHIMPLNVLKQVVVMALAMTSESTIEFHQELRRFVLNRTQTNLPPPYQVYTYFNSNGMQRFASEVVISKVDENATSYVEAEVALPPFGYCVTSTTGNIKSLADLLGLYNISRFSEFDFNMWTTLHMRLPMKETHQPFPLDYRTVTQIQAETNS